ncbi:protein dopey-1-like isoform X4 [Lineus longissimus]|uniref:protein dopey-1-like isoform X4 n=1 Tax=Lineus longissimus TaxID=88925 RepID=UPI00315D035C
MSTLTVEECELLSDSKYRAYISQVEKALRSFENTSEWADLISALGKLNKVLLSHVKYPVVPKKVTIGKRLAQCLHPALPSGVHLKALETYEIIFKCIGPKRLGQDLFTYSAGLFPLLAYAAMNVKPTLLKLYETHFVPLSKAVKPGLTGLLLGLLPGLEEGSEYYDRTNTLLQEFCVSAQPTFFYGCLWECVLISPSVRLAAITFTLAHFNRKQSMEDQLHFIGTNIDTMVNALCSAVQDTSVLVQRSFLDFLLFGFPMHNSQLTKDDMTKIVVSAVHVVLRRDMSLNRRLFAWLLGTSANGLAMSGVGGVRDDVADSPEHKFSVYFNKYSRDLLIHAVRQSLRDIPLIDVKTSAKPSNLKPFRMLISLLDKPEIGPVIIEDVLVDVFRCLYRECMPFLQKGGDMEVERRNSIGSKNGKNGKGKDERSYEEKTATELIKTANLLFTTFEPYFLWDFVSRKFEEVCAETRSRSRRRLGGRKQLVVKELCELVDFLLETVSVETYTETQTEYLPDLLRKITTSLTLNCDTLEYDELTACLELCNKILTKVQPSMTMVDDSDDDSVRTSLEGKQEQKEARKTVEKTLNPSRDEREASPDFVDSEISEPYVSAESDLDSEYSKSPLKKIGTPGRRMAGSEMASPTTLIQACVQSFQTFYYTFVTKRVFSSEEVVKTSMERLLMSSDVLLERQTEGSEDSAVYSGSENYDSDKRYLEMLCVSRDCCDAYTKASQLLVEFSTFPMYCTEHYRLLDHTRRKGYFHVKLPNGEVLSFPPWLQALLTCCSYVNHFELQTSSVSTMLDLICLTQSVIGEADEQGRPRNTGMGTISVVIMPSLSPQMLGYLNDQTYFYKIVATRLWNYLSDQTPHYHQKAVELLYQLHQLAPSTWTCEDVIGAALVLDDLSKRIEAYKKFAVLWHLTRSQKPKSGLGLPARTFDRSMFVLLDSLQVDTSATKALTHTWMTHAIQRGDIARILEPVLLMLLHPDTARISIQHVNIHQPRKVTLPSDDPLDETSSEAKIYAISSEGGNIIYHVSGAEGGKNINKKNADELRVIAMTSVCDTKSGSNKIASTSTQQHLETDLPFEKVDPSNLKLRVNPFGSESSLDKIIFDGYELPKGDLPNVRSATRLDKETCKKEGISFDDEDSGEDAETEDIDDDDVLDHDSPEAIVHSILEDILQAAFQRAESREQIELQVSESMNEIRDKRRSFSTTSKEDVDEDILGAIEQHMKASEIDSPDCSDSEGKTSSHKEKEMTDIPGIHPLHTHILLYFQKYDCQRTLYALSTLKAILTANPRLVICAMATTTINSVRTPHLHQLQDLLCRHRKSIFGKNFYSDLTNEAMSTYRSTMYAEILISLCLYFIRSYYPNLMMSNLSEDQLNANKEVQILSTEILTMLLSELVSLARDSGKAFAIFLSDLLSRCKVQKATLHCILASVYNSRQKHVDPLSNNITEAIISFNEENMDANTNETFQMRMLNLINVLIILEDQIKQQKGDVEPLPAGNPDWDRPKVNFTPQLSSFKYTHAQPVAYQGMLLSAVLSALRQQHLCHMHRHWINMIMLVMPYLSRSLGNIVMAVVNQICRNLELLATEYEAGTMTRQTFHQPHSVPPDHIVTMLEGITTLCHYCLLDNVSQVSVGQPVPLHSSVGTYDHTNSGSGQIFSNLIHVFTPSAGSREPSPQKDFGDPPPVIMARRGLLSILPRIIASLSSIWKAIYVSELKQKDNQEQASWTMGFPKTVRQHILEFLSPISVHHNVNLLAAVAVVWNDRRKRESYTYKRVIPSICEDQLLLVDLVSSIKVLPTDTLVQTVKQVIKQPPPTSQDRNKKRTPLEVSMLQFFYAYVQQTTSMQLLDSWPSLLSLLKEGLQINLSAPGQFLLLAILNEFVQKMPPFEDKKDHKDVQVIHASRHVHVIPTEKFKEITQKLLEACSVIAGSSLEQTTWFRRNLAVKSSLQTDLHELHMHMDDHEDETELGEQAPESSTKMSDAKTIMTNAQYSVHALVLLAELTAPLLDVVYGSDEKEKVVPFLTTAIMYNVFPYLKHHTTKNLPSFRACSQILASLSGYQYTRKAWKKEAFDLLMDVSFFRMNLTCIGFWRTIIDNLMTHDKTTFKDLMTRVTTAQSGSLHLFSNREAEFEQRAQLLKKLSFVIFCSETDQYQRYMPEIQERLADSLKLPQVPGIQAQVFLCFRVLTLRISPQHLTSLWPTIITELVHVFLQIEQEMSPDGEDCKSSSGSSVLYSAEAERMQLQRIAALDASWAYNNGLNAHNNPAWLKLYLSACKLLDLALVMPADALPQFQLYRWAFIGDTSDEGKRKKSEEPSFIPHCIRIARLLNKRVEHDPPVINRPTGYPMLTVSNIRTLDDLHGFFNTLYQADLSEKSIPASSQSDLRPSMSAMHKSKSAPEITDLASNDALYETKAKTWKDYVEEIIERDFLDPVPKN